MSNLEGQATIYRIVRIGTDECYVGHTSADLKHRKSRHFSLLRRGKHHSKYMQNVWNKHGEAAFALEAIEVCAESEKLVREQHHIDTMNSVFNHAKVAGSKKGMKLPEKQIEKLRQMMKGNQYTKGRVQPEEERQRRSTALKGREQSAEHRANAKEAMKGKPHPKAVGHVVTAETRAKIKAATDATRPSMTGKRHSPETIEKIRQANIATALLKGGAGMTGKTQSAETRAKISAAQKGRPGKRHSADTIAKMRQSNIERTARKRLEAALLD